MKRFSLSSWANYAACVAILVVLQFAFSLPVSAQGAGYDVFQTGSGASVDLSGAGLGVVSLQGVPIQNSTGNADTIMYRPQPVPSGGGTIPVNLYALFMKSQNPVTYNGQSADVYITVNNSGGAISASTLPQPDSLSASTGTITVYPSTSTFDSTITINADVILVTAGGSPSDSTAVLGHQPATPITLSQTGSSYSTTPPSGYPLTDGTSASSSNGFAASTTTSSGLSSGGFYPRPMHNGSHPVVPASTCTTGNTTVSSGSAAKKIKAAATTNNEVACLISPTASQ